jgi:hypothetical protein
MTEEELVELGFEKISVLDEESQNGYDYYYYQKELCENVVLHSVDSAEVKDNDWYLRCWDIPAIRIHSKLHYAEFLEVLNNIICGHV